MLKVIKMYTDWCQPCKQYTPIFQQAASRYADVNFVEINAENDLNAAVKYKVKGVPTTIFEKDGVELNRKSGIMSLNELSSNIEKYK